MTETELIEMEQASGPVRPLENWQITENKARAFAMSFIMPAALKATETEAIVNSMLIFELAHIHNTSPLIIAQNLQMINGKVSWDAKYIISKVNQCGVFSTKIGFEVKGAGESLSVTAFATLKESGERVSATCDMRMAKLEEWTRNKKYQSMPEQMLCYRAANFLARRYCPEIYVGLYTGDEVEDMAYSVVESASVTSNGSAGEMSIKDKIAAAKAAAKEAAATV